MPTIIETRQLSKVFRRDGFAVEALSGINLTVDEGEFMALMGPSGSGKSTLLYLIAAMDRTTSGDVLVADQNLGSLDDVQIARWRNETIGFVFQSFNLIPVLSALENVELPLKLTHLRKKERIEHAETALRLVGLEDRMHHLPRQLSGGQEQRVAIARAIVTDPKVILADEPTGNLDSHTGGEIIELLKNLRAEKQTTLVIATHDANVAAHAERVVELADGQIA